MGEAGLLKAGLICSLRLPPTYSRNTLNVILRRAERPSRRMGLTRANSAPRIRKRPRPTGAAFNLFDEIRLDYIDLTISSVIFFASPNSIMVWSRKNSSFWMPA